MGPGRRSLGARKLDTPRSALAAALRHIRSRPQIASLRSRQTPSRSRAQRESSPPRLKKPARSPASRVPHAGDDGGRPRRSDPRCTPEPARPRSSAPTRAPRRLRLARPFPRLALTPPPDSHSRLRRRQEARNKADERTPHLESRAVELNSSNRLRFICSCAPVESPLAARRTSDSNTLRIAICEAKVSAIRLQQNQEIKGPGRAVRWSCCIRSR